MKGGLGNLMKQAKEMQENMEKAQAELANLEVTGESGGGMVKVTMTGKHDVRRHKVETTTQDRMSGLTSGLNLPAGMKLPF